MQDCSLGLTSKNLGDQALRSRCCNTRIAQPQQCPGVPAQPDTVAQSYTRQFCEFRRVAARAAHTTDKHRQQFLIMALVRGACCCRWTKHSPIFAPDSTGCPQFYFTRMKAKLRIVCSRREAIGHDTHVPRTFPGTQFLAKSRLESLDSVAASCRL